MKTGTLSSSSSSTESGALTVGLLLATSANYFASGSDLNTDFVALVSASPNKSPPPVNQVIAAVLNAFDTATLNQLITSKEFPKMQLLTNPIRSNVETELKRTNILDDPNMARLYEDMGQTAGDVFKVKPTEDEDEYAKFLSAMNAVVVRGDEAELLRLLNKVTGYVPNANTFSACITTAAAFFQQAAAGNVIAAASSSTAPSLKAAIALCKLCQDVEVFKTVATTGLASCEEQATQLLLTASEITTCTMSDLICNTEHFSPKTTVPAASQGELTAWESSVSTNGHWSAEEKARLNQLITKAQHDGDGVPGIVLWAAREGYGLPPLAVIKDLSTAAKNSTEKIRLKDFILKYFTPKSPPPQSNP